MKKSFFTLLFSISITFLFFSCQEKNRENTLEIQSNRNDTLQNAYAEAFRIIYLDNSIKLDILEPSTQKIVKSYFISNTSNAYNELVFNPQKVVATSTTNLGMMRYLGLEETITGVSSYQYLCQSVDPEKVKEVGEMGFTDPEKFMTVNPDLILYAGYDMSDPLLTKFEQVGLQSLLIYEWKETHPLGRAEWIKVYGLLFQKEKEAHLIFEEIENEYLKMVELFAEVEVRPTVLSGTPVGDVFNSPAGNSFMAQLFKDANVNYIYQNTEGTGSLNLTIEEVITNNLETDFWVNVDAQTNADIQNLNSKFNLLQSVQKNKVYSFVANGNCYWEKSIIEPHKILEDFGKIFHPELFDNQELTYYSQIK